jgi:hypothetical protein
LLNRAKGHWEAPIIELVSPNYAKVGANMMNLEGNKVDVLGVMGKGPSYRYFMATKFLSILKELFDKPPRGEEEEV